MSPLRPSRWLALLLLASPLTAGLNLDVRSDEPCKVYLGDEYLGDTPLILKDVVPGAHRVIFESVRTGERKEFAAYSPSVATTEKVLYAKFLPHSVPPALETLQPAPVYVPVARPPAPRRWETSTVQPVAISEPPPRKESRGKTHTRNTLLGLTAASQIMNQDKKDKVRQRNVGAGLIILNELFRK